MLDGLYNSGFLVENILRNVSTEYASTEEVSVLIVDVEWNILWGDDDNDLNINVGMCVNEYSRENAHRRPHGWDQCLVASGSGTSREGCVGRHLGGCLGCL
jgi:hypothetical protein